MFRKQPQPRRFVPNLENLEDRCCPSTMMGLADHGQPRAHGDSSDLSPRDHCRTPGACASSPMTSLSLTGVNKILVDTGAGNDMSLTVQLSIQ